MFQNPSPEQLAALLKSAHTIAVVGLSDNPSRESYGVAARMQQRGYRIIPVNPNVTEVLGERAYPDLESLPPNVQVDIVNVFRRSDALMEVVASAVRLGAPVIWAQQGVYDEEAAKLAHHHGKVMVMDCCIAVAHSLYVRT
ncbi:CoA-binding protein [Alicyclobacillus contaminans]|uniref:CoA-binding protein n=1 Tax=Alicyclobacillus contaminans TaxID=392016 RepID=UPI00041FB591|nr:CoA-binding protein [Alicyclobacillus contaminans]GMA49244.1 CoA-binding protein [Alicyclobacillus contaminans]